MASVSSKARMALAGLLRSGGCRPPFEQPRLDGRRQRQGKDQDQDRAEGAFDEVANRNPRCATLKVMASSSSRMRADPGDPHRTVPSQTNQDTVRSHHLDGQRCGEGCFEHLDREPDDASDTSTGMAARNTAMGSSSMKTRLKPMDRNKASTGRAPHRPRARQTTRSQPHPDARARSAHNQPG